MLVLLENFGSPATQSCGPGPLWFGLIADFFSTTFGTSDLAGKRAYSMPRLRVQCFLWTLVPG